MSGEFVYDMPEAEYHAHPALSSTQMKRLLESPAHYRHALTHRVEKPEFDLGHAVHAKVLGVGMDVAVIPDDVLAKNGSTGTNAARALIEETRAAGKVPIKSDQWALINGAAEAVLQHPVAGALFSTGDAEVSAFWTDPATDVPCRARFDWLTVLSSGRPTVVDLKTIGRSALTFDRSVPEHGYDTQAWHYLDGHAAVTGFEGAAFLWVVVELEPPHGVVVREAIDDPLYTGQLKATRAREIFRDCTAAGVWPSYPTDIEPITLPRWAIAAAEERYAS